MASSIMQDTKECYLSRRTDGLHKHHIYGGPRRMASDKWGCWVWLYHELHNTTSRGVHTDRVLDLQLKQDCQERFEELYGHEQFMKIFGKSWR